MKQVIAVIRPYLAERLLESLRLSPLEALQVTEVKGFGRQKSYLDQYSSTEYSLAFLPKVEITLYVDKKFELKYPKDMELYTIEQYLDQINSSANTNLKLDDFSKVEYLYNQAIANR